MLALNFLTPEEFLRDVAMRAQRMRLAANLTQAELATKAGMSLSSLKRFERTGLIAFDALVRIGFVLGCENEFATLFQPKAYQTLEDVIASKAMRQRARPK